VRLEIGAPAGSVTPTPAAVRDALAGLPGVHDVHLDVNTAGTFEARIESGVGVDLRSDLAALVVGRGWNLLGLRAESLSLEEVFLALTRSEEGEVG